MGQWRLEYDMFWGFLGGIPEWLFVRAPYRGSGIAAAIVAQICADVRAAGGKFLRAGSGEAQVSSAYEKVATGSEARSHNLGGDAFHLFADLAGRPPREIVRNLPDVSRNHSGDDPRSRLD